MSKHSILTKESSYNENHSHLRLLEMETKFLSGMKLGQLATIKNVIQHSADDSIARRLRNLGFVEGEEVKLVSYGPIGQDPLLVQIGFTRFALRSSEAMRVEIQH